MIDPRLILLCIAIVLFVYIVATTAFAPTKKWSPPLTGTLEKIPDDAIQKAVAELLRTNFSELRKVLDDALAKGNAQNEKVTAEVKIYFKEVNHRLDSAGRALEDLGKADSEREDSIAELGKEFEIIKVQMNSLRLKVADGNRTFNISLNGVDAKKAKPLLKRAGLSV